MNDITVPVTIAGETRETEIRILLDGRAYTPEAVVAATVGKGKARYAAYGYFRQIDRPLRRTEDGFVFDGTTFKMDWTTEVRNRKAVVVGWDVTNLQDQTRV